MLDQNQVDEALEAAHNSYEKVCELAFGSGDNESAHFYEDGALYAALEAIAMCSRAEDAQQIALAVLRLKSLPYDRWYA